MFRKIFSYSTPAILLPILDDESKSKLIGKLRTTEKEPQNFSSETNPTEPKPKQSKTKHQTKTLDLILLEKCRLSHDKIYTKYKDFFTHTDIEWNTKL